MAVSSTVADWCRSGVPSDEEIVRRVVAGEVALFEVLMRRNNQRLYRAVRSIVQAEDEVEEVMQQSYVAAFGALSRFTHASKFSTWLIRIGLNAALASRRRASHLIPFCDEATSDEETPVALVPRTPPTPEDRASTRELSVLLEEVLDGLPPQYRMVLMLREVEGFSTAETAEALSVSEDLVKTRLHRAKRLARQTLYAWTQQSAAAAFQFHASRCDRVVAAVLGRLSEAG